jgi:hypothetical protein
VIAIAPDGKKEVGNVTTEPMTASAVLIDRGGFGVRIVLESPRPVRRGENNTILIQLTDGPAPASKVGIQYKLVPFVEP